MFYVLSLLWFLLSFSNLFLLSFKLFDLRFNAWKWLKSFGSTWANFIIDKFWTPNYHYWHNVELSKILLILFQKALKTLRWIFLFFGIWNHRNLWFDFCLRSHLWKYVATQKVVKLKGIFLEFMAYFLSLVFKALSTCFYYKIWTLQSLSIKCVLRNFFIWFDRHQHRCTCPLFDEGILFLLVSHRLADRYCLGATKGVEVHIFLEL